jgi:hypothetical protein
MSNELWGIIDKSKEGKPYLKAVNQYMNLIEVLSKHSKGEIAYLNKEWRDYVEKVKSHPDFNLLHQSRGGFVDSGDDGFDYDFPHWVVGQGEEVVDMFLKNGPAFLKNYVIKYKVPKDDLTFENLGYTFEEAFELQTEGKQCTTRQIMHIASAAKEKFRVESLTLSGNEEPVGYRATYGVIPRVVNGKKVFWQFDIPNNSSVQEGHLRILSSASQKSLELVPSGDLLLTQDEIKSGIHAVSLEDNLHAVNFIVRSARGVYQ